MDKETQDTYRDITGQEKHHFDKPKGDNRRVCSNVSCGKVYQLMAHNQKYCSIECKALKKKKNKKVHGRRILEPCIFCSTPFKVSRDVKKEDMFCTTVCRDRHTVTEIKLVRKLKKIDANKLTEKERLIRSGRHACRKDKTWSGKEHTCCHSRYAHYHMLGCKETIGKGIPDYLEDRIVRSKHPTGDNLTDLIRSFEK